MAALVLARDGMFYGTTGNGGQTGNGTVFKISAEGVFTGLYSFSNNGEYPTAALVQGNDGDLYGTTQGGGASSNGTAFKITTTGVLTTLHDFTGTNDGSNPSGGLVLGSDGLFFGTTAGGGDNEDGTVFKMTAAGVLTTLNSFSNNNHGALPSALTQARDGSFYGTAESGGNHGYGTVFKITTNGMFSSLHAFSNSGDGGSPLAGLTLAKDGSFYAQLPAADPTGPARFSK